MNRRALLPLLLVFGFLPTLARAEEERKKKGGGASYIQLDTLVATITRADGRRGVMTAEVGVDIADAGLHARAAQSTPLLHANFAEVLRIYAAGLPHAGRRRANPDRPPARCSLQVDPDAGPARRDAAAGRDPDQLTPDCGGPATGRPEPRHDTRCGPLTRICAQA